MVGYISSTGKYQASMHILGKLIFLGEYKSYKEAEKAEKSATHETDDFLRAHFSNFSTIS
jgi:hypothetical protein